MKMVNPIQILGKKNNHSLFLPIFSPHFASIVQFPQRKFQKEGFVQPVKLENLEEAKPINFVYKTYYFIFFTYFLLFCIFFKNSGLTNHALIHRSLTYQNGFPVQGAYIILNISHWTFWFTLKCLPKCYYLLLLPFEALLWWFHFIWFLKYDMTTQ